MNGGLEPKLPLIYDKNEGPYAMIQTNQEMVHQNMKNIVLTNPGERLMDPRFGVGIKSYLFETDKVVNHSDLTQQITAQVSKYIPGVRVNNVLIKKNNEHEFYITISYNMQVQGSKSNINFTFKTQI